MVFQMNVKVELRSGARSMISCVPMGSRIPRVVFSYLTVTLKVSIRVP